MAISEHLDLAARVAAAEPLIGLWDLHHPARPQLASLDDIAEAFRAGTPHENDRLLLRLAELAHVDGGGSVDAAAVLAKLVLPGVAARLRRSAQAGSGARWISMRRLCCGSCVGLFRTRPLTGWRR